MMQPSWLKGRKARNLAELAEEAMTRGDALFIECDDGRTFTYGAFWQLAGQIAGVLASAGVVRGDRVALQVEKSIEAIAVFWACARAGFVFLPLNTAYTADEVSYFLGDAEPAAFITTPQRLAALTPVAEAAHCRLVLTLDETGGGSLAEAARGHDGRFVNASLEWNDLAAILYTSGTTGRSKGAMLSHGNLASNGLALAKAWAFTSADRLIHALPVYHTHGLFTATNTVLLTGGTLLFRRRFDVADVLALMPRATSMMGVPTFYTRLLQQEGLTQALAGPMRLFISGSAPLLAETHRQFAARTGHHILERYGMTETNMNTSNPYVGARKAGTVGLPLTGTEVRVVDRESGAELPPGQDGMIEVRGPNVFAGYWRNPEKTAAEFTSDGFFITGDLGHFDEDGYLLISGRGKDLVITGGFNVYPREIELLIDAMPGVVESAIIGLPHPDLGEGVTAVVVAEGKTTEAEVLAGLEGRLARFKMPKRVVLADDLPRNAMGKVQKAVLRERYRALYQN